MAADAAHGVVLLVAGGSRRLGRSKQLVTLDGEPLAARAARLALATAPVDAVAVLGAGAASVRAVLLGLPIRTVVCADWEAGMGRSLEAGLSALDARCEGALVMLCDQPGLTEAHLLGLRDLWRETPGRATASGYDGVVGVPALLPRAWFTELSGRVGDRGARELLRERSRDVGVVVDEALARDVDAPKDVPPG